MSKKLLMNNYSSANNQKDETVFAEYSFYNNVDGNGLPARLTIDGGYSVIDEVEGDITHRKLINLNKNAPTDIAFSGKAELLSVGYINVRNLDSIDSMFKICNRLISIDGSEWDTSNIVRMGSFAIGCGNLRELKVSNWNTSKVERMGGFVCGCLNLKELNISNWDTSKVDYIQDAFRDCNNLSGEITIRNPNIVSYNNVFYGASIAPKSKFIVKYIDEETKVMAEKLVKTKFANANVFLWEGDG